MAFRSINDSNRHLCNNNCQIVDEKIATAAKSTAYVHLPGETTAGIALNHELWGLMASMPHWVFFVCADISVEPIDRRSLWAAKMNFLFVYVGNCAEQTQDLFHFFVDCVSVHAFKSKSEIDLKLKFEG